MTVLASVFDPLLTLEMHGVRKDFVLAVIFGQLC